MTKTMRSREGFALTLLTFDSLGVNPEVSGNTVSGVNHCADGDLQLRQPSTTKELLLSLSVGSGHSQSFAYDSSKRVQSVTRTIDGHSYTTSYQYNAGNQLTQMVYPGSGRTLNVAHDSAGRVSSMADQYRTYINNFAYNGAGQVTGFSLGSVASESVNCSYDAAAKVANDGTQTYSTTARIGS